MYPSLWQQVSLLYNVFCSKYVKMTKTALGIVGKWQGGILGEIWLGILRAYLQACLVCCSAGNIDMQLTEGF